MHSSRPCVAVALASTLLFSVFGGMSQADEARTVLPGSIRPVAQAQAAVASAVKANDLSTPMDFSVALQLRNLPELRTRIAHGEVIGLAELAAKYPPLPADVAKVSAWLKSQGFTVSDPDPMSLAVFASGTWRRVQQAFQVSFAKVVSGGNAFTSAVSAPSIPTALATAVLSVNGLQPDIQAQKRANSSCRLGRRRTWAINRLFLSGEIIKAYGGLNGGQTGSGQKIAIVIDTFPNKTDLTAFWTACNVAQVLTNIEFIQVVGGALPAPSGEETLDVEWSSSIAPSAKVRVYAAHDLQFVHLDQVFQKILSDLSTQPALHQVSMSLGLGETFMAEAAKSRPNPTFCDDDGAGLTVLASSGDSGSDRGGQLQVHYAASDPSGRRQGTKALPRCAAAGTVTNETAWTGGGGGVSVIFDRPSWQTGAGLTPELRLVPDVSARPQTRTRVP